MLIGNPLHPTDSAERTFQDVNNISSLLAAIAVPKYAYVAKLFPRTETEMQIVLV